MCALLPNIFIMPSKYLTGSFSKTKFIDVLANPCMYDSSVFFTVVYHDFV